MVVMITGGTGFLGSSLARYVVLEQGVSNVVLFDRHPSPEAVRDIGDRVTIVRGDVCEPAELESAVRAHGVDRIAHMGFAAGVPAPQQVPAYVQLQCLGTTNVFETARRFGITRVVNASSVAVWGDRQDGTVTEEDPVRPRNMYAAHKLWSEHLAEHYNAAYDMTIISLRIGAVFGFGRLARLARLHRAGLTAEPPSRPHFTTNPELIAAGIPVTMPPDAQIADFLYASDNAKAWWLALTATAPGPGVFNLRGEQRPVGDMTHHLRTLRPEADITVASEPLDVDQLMDNGRIVSELGFTPRFTLESALADYFEQIHQARS
jgi:nucleoside-diphosphate-sugar epimerase